MERKAFKKLKKKPEVHTELENELKSMGQNLLLLYSKNSFWPE